MGILRQRKNMKKYTTDSVMSIYFGAIRKFEYVGDRYVMSCYVVQKQELKYERRQYLTLNND